MRRKTIGALFGTVLGISLLGGCAGTPEESLVKQKGEASMKNYEEAEPLTVREADEAQSGAGEDSAGTGADAGTENTAVSSADGSAVNVLRRSLGAPEHYQSEIRDESGNLQVITDADVELPDADKVSAIAVSQHPIDQSVFDRVTETFFPDAQIYTSDSYNQMTKDDCQREIEKLKGYVAEGNPDPYNMGTDEEGNYYFDIYAEIEQYEQMYQEAPEAKTLVEVQPQYGLTVDDGQGGTYTYDDRFLGVACQPDGAAFQYIIKSYDSMPMELRIERIREASVEDSIIQWIEYSYVEEDEGVPAREDMPGEAGITLEEAIQLADTKVEELGLESMELTAWEYCLCRETAFGGGSGESYLDAGYMLHYTRRLNGIPITYTTERGGNLEDMDSEMETWCYETLDIIVTEDGIDTVYYDNPYDIGEVRTENLSLLSFEKIMEIYEKMMLIQNADALNWAVSETWKIDRITFGYSRIYEPSTDSRSGLLVPVWDFFGGDSVQETDGSSYDSNPAYSSYLTLNAIDGSVINRALGY